MKRQVLLAENENTAIISFRGSESTADLITNSQTFEPVSHAEYFNGKALMCINIGLTQNSTDLAFTNLAYY